MSDTPTDLATEMVAASMGYALAKLSEDPQWLWSLVRSGSNLEVALRPDAEDFMKYRGRFIVAEILTAREKAEKE